MKWLNLFGEPPVQVVARRLYSQAVEKARQPEFYLYCGVPDTPDGRFDMVVLHVVLVMRRLKRDHAQTAETAQALFDLMFADMDQNLREMGVGDVGVGPRIKGMARGFFGRLAAYDLALGAKDDSALCAALRRNLYRKCRPHDRDVEAVAFYMREEAAKLDALPIKVILDGPIFTSAPVESLPRSSQ